VVKEVKSFVKFARFIINEIVCWLLVGGNRVLFLILEHKKGTLMICDDGQVAYGPTVIGDTAVRRGASDSKRTPAHGNHLLHFSAHSKAGQHQ